VTIHLSEDGVIAQGARWTLKVVFHDYLIEQISDIRAETCRWSTMRQPFGFIFHDFPWPTPDSMTFQAWKISNSMTFHDLRAPGLYTSIFIQTKGFGECIKSVHQSINQNIFIAPHVANKSQAQMHRVQATPNRIHWENAAVVNKTATRSRSVVMLTVNRASIASVSQPQHHHHQHHHPCHCHRLLLRLLLSSARQNTI